MPKNTQVVPGFPEPYVRKHHKRGRPKKVGRPKKNVYEKVRSSPSKRAGARYNTVTIPEEAYLMLKELALFYKVSMGTYFYSLVLPAFDHAYQESLTLQRIDTNRKKEKDEIQDRDDVPRRTHF